MTREIRRLFLAVVTWSAVAVEGPLQADDPFVLTPQASEPGSVIHPWQDDATLYDVEFLGAKAGWAVGDHGSVWKSTDGGAEWKFCPITLDASLRSVCLLSRRVDGNLVGTSQVAWVAGRATRPYSRVGFGVLFKTTDGGASWQPLGAGQNLPPLNYVKFFGPDEGIAAGEATPAFPTGVLTTVDGGRTWQPAAGEFSPGWHSAAFSELHDGVVAGPRGRLALVAGTNVGPSRFGNGSLRAVRAVTMSDGLTGWAVGDGAMVLVTTNGGVSWEQPPQPLSPEASRFMDLKAVAAAGSRVWLAGCPGSAVWTQDITASDGTDRTTGEGWFAAATGSTAPIHALHFASEDLGWAVGEFGSILRTTDGGLTWAAIRGGNRRAAVLTVNTSPDRIAFGMLAKYAGDQGYRSAAVVMPRRDIKESSDLPGERQLSDAIAAVGANHGVSGWRLPIGLPEVETDVDALVAEWQRHTEGQLADVVLSNLVATIRTWRPSVIAIDDPVPGDATATLIRDAVSRAVHEAADSTKFLEHLEYARLAPWQVQHVFLRQPADTQAGITIAPYDVLPWLGTTVEGAASAGRSLVVETRLSTPEPEPFVLARDGAEDRFALVSQRDFWSGLPLTPGSDARRAQLPLDEDRYARQQEVAIRQKNFRGIARQFAAHPQRGAQLVAEIRGVVRDMPRSQAARQIAYLAQDYRRRQQWDLAEATFIELIDQYPDQTASVEAMLWLLHLWSSEEMAWQRSRSVQLSAQQSTTNRSGIEDRMVRVLKAAQQQNDDPVRTARELTYDPLSDLQPLQNLPAQSPGDWRSASVNYWQQQALQMARVIGKRMPEAYQTPDVLWPITSVLRRQNQVTIADSLYRRHVSVAQDDPVSRLASGELWLSQPADETPSHLGYCTWATVRPMLDGVLGDDCWHEAREIPLTFPTGSAAAARSSAQAFAQMCCDGQFLYLAASLPRHPGTPDDRPEYSGRVHDADLTGFDRVSFYLDLDRDYTTSYAIHVDQRGQVAESCWEDTSWNPQLFVAVDGDADRWRVEMAVPLEELAPQAPRRQSAWAVAVVRTIPKAGWQSWVHPASGPVSASSFGLIQFR